MSYTDSQSVSHMTTFTYGPDSFMVKQVEDNVETRFVVSGGLVLQERDSSNAVQRAYVGTLNQAYSFST